MSDLAPSTLRGVRLTQHPSQDFGCDAPTFVSDFLKLAMGLQVTGGGHLFG